MVNSVLFAVLTAGAATTSSALDYISANTERFDSNTNSNTNVAKTMIVGGEQSQVGHYPYFVDMGGCGGALVAPDVVLFAAHCLDWKDKQLSIGAFEIDSVAQGAQERFCDIWIRDPLYGTGGNTLNYDFALCKLNEPVTIDQSFVVLELNEEDSFPTDGTDLLVMGLGKTSFTGSVPQFLRNVTVPVISNEVCDQPSWYSGLVTDIMICAGFENGGKDSCFGDSGGPMVKRTYRDGGGSTFVDTHVGVVSWGIECARPRNPGVYARTSKRLAWMKDTMCTTLDSVASFCENNNPPPLPPSCNTGEDLTIQVSTGPSFAEKIAWTFRGGPNNQPIMTRKYLVNNYQNEHKFCLESNTCYDWEITAKIPFEGSYRFVLNGNEIVSLNGDFGVRKAERFCTNAPVPPPTNAPVPLPTNAPVPPPTKSPTKFPTRLPTKFPTNAPIPPPTKSPTKFPTRLPTESPTKTLICKDDAKFKFRNKRKKTCKKWVAKGKQKDVKKKCMRKYKNRRVYEYCPKTCARRARLGRCA